jgi:phage tail-like protein
MKKLLKKLALEANATQFAEAGRRDPYKNFNYLVEITGNNNFAKAGFSSVSGLTMGTEVVEYREGGDNFTPRKSPGQTSFDDITLERGMSEDVDAWNWATKVFSVNEDSHNNDPKFRATILIKLRDRENNVVKTWEVQRAWISNYETGELNGDGNDVLVETMTVTHEGFRLL